jgi:hypothetical protein
LEREEIEKLLSLEWSSIHSYITVLIAANTGMRMGEIRISVRHSWGRKSNLKCTKNEELSASREFFDGQEIYYTGGDTPAIQSGNKGNSNLAFTA